MQSSLLLILTACLAFFHGAAAWAADAQVLRPRVPPEQIDAVRAVKNPFQPAPELIEKGKALFEGKAFCKACHGADGRGLPKELELKGLLPRNFTDKKWQATRTDGELFWILKNGSPGTDMAPFVPLVLTEEEAWQVLLYVRSFNGR
ncbi:MAG: cytochrome c [Nitrospirae bacterium RIFCSPLOWO2_02_FULL_62_14]|nr:MAG: cytochrome c [Nitrospirae bacterium RIFCSPLOWO2_02_FULL_62_14]